ncbi:MAG: DUF2961 domain-containing protein [Pyrinomonadaceae bacterium MAG19_C2-C3]|nr:DUF2961 domain-containing protein [Pyrinomonadaceae bacterium MAG19_C2-C3]
MMPIYQACFLIFITAVIFTCRPTAHAQVKLLSGIEQLHRLDLLPTFKPSVKIGSVSSYDRTGGNDDGFNGTYSFVRKEADGLVIADLKGAGVITRIWTPTPTDDIVEFYFDGESTPRIKIKFRDIFTGNVFPFLAPVVGIGAGGFYSYLPLAYKKSCKVLVKTQKIEFYQINFATYADDAGIETYTAIPSNDFKANLEKAQRFLASTGADISSYSVSDNQKLNTRNFKGTLAPGKTITVFETDKPGRIAGLKLAPASAFAGKERDTIIKIYWDGDANPAIVAPVGDLFGYAWGEPAVKSLLLGTIDDTNYIYLPMPFDKSARIELVSERRDRAPLDISAEIKYADVGRRNDEGKLYALWRRENLTTEGQPYTFLETRGRGHAVGFILQAQGTQPGSIPEFFEGDDETTLDGELVIRGTGSEDFFNGGWYDVPGRWDDRVSLPLSGSLDFKRHLARTGGYRFMLTDVYPFERSILQTIEHGPVGNKFPTDYASVSFFYSENRPTANLNLPKLADRKVSDPTSVVFTPGWTTPIHAFSWSNAVLMKKDDKIGDENLRHLSMKADGREVFGTHYISFICEMPQAGKYRVSIQAIKGADGAIVQLFKNEIGIGTPVDLYASTRQKSAEMPLGELDMNEGDNRVMFKLIGKNDASTGLGFDIYRIIFERIG